MIGNRNEYLRMAECEREHWWYRSLHDLTLATINQHFQSLNLKAIDLGCGTGGLLSRLKNYGYQNLTGFDISEDAVEIAREKGLPVHQGDVLNVANRLNPGSYDVIVINDVLYFFDANERHTLLVNLVNALRPGGLLMMNVPAFGAFRGSHDLAVGIQERFNRKMVTELMDGQTGVTLTTIFWPFLLSPIIASIRLYQRFKLKATSLLGLSLSRITSDVSLPNRFINRVLYGITRLEGKMGLQHFWGSSMLLTITKDPDASKSSCSAGTQKE